MELHHAMIIAEQVVEQLRPACQGIRVAGSIRREQSLVKDIDIVCIPAMRSAKVRSPLFCNRVFKLGRIVQGKIGDGKHVRIELPQGIMLELFMATPQNVGMIYLIRTGNAAFSRYILTQFNKKGYTSKGGIPTHEKTGEQLFFSNEKAVFHFLGKEWIHPKHRNA